MANLESLTLEQISADIRSLVAEILEIPAEQIDGNASFFEDLGVDSLMGLEIVAAVEKKYRIQIPEENLQRVKTLNDTIALAREYLEKRAAA